MIIRKFAEKDLSQVVELCREIRQHHMDMLNGYFNEQDDAFEKKSFLDTLQNDKVVALVAEDDGEIIGLVYGEFRDAPYLTKPKIADISNFGVKKDKRNRGIGKQLMDAFFKICQERKVDEIRLGVYNQNTIAYKFYENYGFKPLIQRMVLDMNSIVKEN